MARSEGVTLSEFMRLMDRRYRNSYEARRAVPGEVQAFLDRCVEKGLLSTHVDSSGLTRYRATSRLAAAFGDLT